MNRTNDNTNAPSAPQWLDDDTRRRRDEFARAALTALLTGDPDMPTRIAARHAWATATAMLNAEPGNTDPS